MLGMELVQVFPNLVTLTVMTLNTGSLGTLPYLLDPNL